MIALVLPLPRRLVGGEDLRRVVDEVPDAVRRRLNVGELHERHLAAGLRPHADRVTHGGRRDRPADVDLVSVDVQSAVDAPIETDGGAPVTLTVPFSVGMQGIVVAVRAGRVDPLRVDAVAARAARRRTLRCWPRPDGSTVSTFFQRTVSPPAIVTVFGAKPVLLMFTVFSALREATAKPAPARAHTAVAIKSVLSWWFPLVV